MQLVLRYTGLRRPIVSLPYWFGMIQGFITEKLPESIFTLTRDQVCIQIQIRILSVLPLG